MLEKATGGYYPNVYSFLSGVQDPSRVIEEAKKFLDDVPSQYKEVVRRALTELQGTVSKLYDDLSRESPPEGLKELIMFGVRLALYTDDRLSDVLYKHFDYLLSRIPLDVVSLPRSQRKHYMLINPTKKDLYTVLSRLENGKDVEDAKVWLTREVAPLISEPYFRLFLWSLVRKAVKVDVDRSSVRAWGDEFRLPDEKLTTLLLNIGDRTTYDVLARRWYAKLAAELSAKLGKPVEVKEVNVVERAGMATVVAEVLGQDVTIRLNMSTYGLAPYEARVSLIYRNLIMPCKYIEIPCSTLECTVDAITGTLASPKFSDLASNLLGAVTRLANRGYNIDVSSNFHSNIGVDIVNVTASKDRVGLLYSIYSNGMLWLRLMLGMPPLVASLMSDNEVYEMRNALAKLGVRADVAIKSKGILIEAHGVSPERLPEFIESAKRIADEHAQMRLEAYRNLDGTEAAVLYMLNDDRVFDEVHSRHGLSKLALAVKATHFFRRYTDVPPKAGIPLLVNLAKRGVLTAEGEGLLLNGRRVYDVVLKYTGNRELALRNERRVLARLMKVYGSVAEFVKDLHSADAAAVAISYGAKKFGHDWARRLAEEMMSSKELWSSLKPSSKVRVLSVAGVEVLEHARKCGWSWVLDDEYLVLSALTANTRNPGEVTKLVLDFFPHLLGEGYTVVELGGEPFVQVGRTILQVKQVLMDGFVFHGTTRGTTVGMLVKGRNAEEAAKTILSELIDAHVDFNTAVIELRNLRETVEVEKGEYRTPAFSVPYLVLRNRATGKKLVVPLQPKYMKVIESVIDKLQTATKTVDEDSNYLHA